MSKNMLKKLLISSNLALMVASGVSGMDGDGRRIKVRGGVA